MRPIAWLLLSAAACVTAPRATDAQAGRDPRAASQIASAAGPTATALIEASGGGGGGLSGNARLSAVGNDGLGVHLELQGATPGPHGVFIADRGGCGEGHALGHYNPNRGAHHGGPPTAVRHGGDLGNIEVDASGKGVLDVVVQDVSLASVANGVVDRALVVTSGADDLHTDPDGDAGPPIACGLILAPPLNR